MKATGPSGYTSGVIPGNPKRKKSVCAFAQELWQNRTLYLMTVPGIAFLLVFCYLPMIMLVVVFKKYNFKDGIWGSPWVGFANFRVFFASASKVWQVTYNTVAINFLSIVSGLIFQLGFAILFNEIRGKLYKKITHTLFFIPYFFSIIVIGSIVYSLFSTEYGTINVLLKGFGLNPVPWYTSPQYWKAIFTLVSIWMGTGYGSLIYLAAMAGFDPAIYEAALIDGATRLQCIRRITLPMLKPTAVILILYALGRIFFGNVMMVYGIVRDFGPLLKSVDMIDSYVFRAMKGGGSFNAASAVGLYQSVFGLVTILTFNRIAKKVGDGNSLF